MLGNSPRDTKPELAVRSAVHRLGLRFVVHAIPEPGVRRRADLVFRGSKVAVFVDGCFWHCCPEHATFPIAHASYWLPKLAATRARDIDTTERLQDLGWAVVRVWEHEPIEQAAAQIAGVVRGRTIIPRRRRRE
jgi:DNA mismatch endonuclease (patch repair protein)